MTIQSTFMVFFPKIEYKFAKENPTQFDLNTPLKIVDCNVTSTL